MHINYASFKPDLSLATKCGQDLAKKVGLSCPPFKKPLE